MNVKVGVYAFRLHLCYKRTACKQFFSSDFCRIFNKAFVLEHTWTSASDFMFDTFKSKKLNKARKPSGSKTGKF